MKRLTTKLLNCLTANHPSNYDCYSSKYLKSKWHRSNHLKSEFLSSQNFNSVHIKVIFPNIKILNVILPNIGIFALILELLKFRSYPCTHWNYITLSFKRLAFWSCPFKLWNSGLIHPNIEILILHIQTLEFSLIFPNIEILILHIQILEFWPYPFKH